ncbi:hypothetical protein ACUH91_00830 [Dermabacteraceae bacterium P9123]
MSELGNATERDIARRAVVRGAAWATPAVVLMGVAPAVASSLCEEIIASPQMLGSDFDKQSFADPKKRVTAEVVSAGGTSRPNSFNLAAAPKGIGGIYVSQVSGVGQYQEVKITFSKPVYKLKFSIGDVDAGYGNLVDDLLGAVGGLLGKKKKAEGYVDKVTIAGRSSSGAAVSFAAKARTQSHVNVERQGGRTVFAATRRALVQLSRSRGVGELNARGYVDVQSAPGQEVKELTLRFENAINATLLTNVLSLVASLTGPVEQIPTEHFIHVSNLSFTEANC